MERDNTAEEDGRSAENDVQRRTPASEFGATLKNRASPAYNTKVLIPGQSRWLRCSGLPFRKQFIAMFGAQEIVVIWYTASDGMIGDHAELPPREYEA